jgi:hypothetical protein
MGDMRMLVGKPGGKTQKYRRIRINLKETEIIRKHPVVERYNQL